MNLGHFIMKLLNLYLHFINFMFICIFIQSFKGTNTPLYQFVWPLLLASPLDPPMLSNL